MTILEEKVRSINCPGDDMLYVDDSKKICLVLAKIKVRKKRKYVRP